MDNHVRDRQARLEADPHLLGPLRRNEQNTGASPVSSTLTRGHQKPRPRCNPS